MNIVKGIFNKKFIFFYSFLLLLIVFLYFNNRYDKAEITYAIIYIIFGMMISLFYILKDYIYSPDRMNYKQVIMEDALFNHKGEIIEEFEAYPLYREFVTFHLNRTSEDPYSDTVTSIQAVKYMKNKMVDSLFIPIDPKDPLLKKYSLTLNQAVGRFLRYAGNLPIIIYNQPFTHTYLNIKLDKEVHISFIDAMKMSKDLYGITNKPLEHIQKYLRLYNLGNDPVAGAKIIGAIYLDYIYTVSKYRTRQARIMARKGQKMTAQPLPERAPETIRLTSSDKESEVSAPVRTHAASETASAVKSTKESSFTFDTKVPEEERRIIPHKDAAEEKDMKDKLRDMTSRFTHKITDSITAFRKVFQSKEETQKDKKSNSRD